MLQVLSRTICKGVTDKVISVAAASLICLSICLQHMVYIATCHAYAHVVGTTLLPSASKVPSCAAHHCMSQIRVAALQPLLWGQHMMHAVQQQQLNKALGLLGLLLHHNSQPWYLTAVIVLPLHIAKPPDHAFVSIPDLSPSANCRLPKTPCVAIHRLQQPYRFSLYLSEKYM